MALNADAAAPSDFPSFAALAASRAGPLTGRRTNPPFASAALFTPIWRSGS